MFYLICPVWDNTLKTTKSGLSQIINVSINVKKPVLCGKKILYFQIEDEPNKIHDQDRVTVKQLIVGLMLKSPEQIQKQVGDHTNFISRKNSYD